MKKNVKQIVTALLGAAVLVFLDQWTKYLAVVHLKDQDPVVLIDGVLELRYVMNEGAAFSLMQKQQIFFYILTLFVLAGVCYLYLFRIPSDSKYRWLNGLCVTITAGALGNFIDRLRLRYVVDFIYFKLIDFPVFNVADIYITCSCAVLFLLMIFVYKESDLQGIL